VNHAGDRAAGLTVGIRVGIAAAGSLIWLSAVAVRLLREDRSWWFARDDAVITLSHARNAAEFGSIGVSPIGDRTEGFSSPLHFGIAYVAELLHSWDYGSLSVVLFVVATLVVGGAATTLIAGRIVALRTRRAVAGSLVASAAGAAIVAASWTSTGWIGSGMENPFVIASGLLLALAADRLSGRTQLAAIAIAMAALGVARVEWSLLLAPVVVALVWSEADRRGQQKCSGAVRRVTVSSGARTSAGRSSARRSCSAARIVSSEQSDRCVDHLRTSSTSSCSCAPRGGANVPPRRTWRWSAIGRDQPRSGQVRFWRRRRPAAPSLRCSPSSHWRRHPLYSGPVRAGLVPRAARLVAVQ
jgi:hypothetical protein